MTDAPDILLLPRHACGRLEGVSSACGGRHGSQWDDGDDGDEEWEGCEGWREVGVGVGMVVVAADGLDQWRHVPPHSCRGSWLRSVSQLQPAPQYCGVAMLCGVVLWPSSSPHQRRELPSAPRSD